MCTCKHTHAHTHTYTHNVYIGVMNVGSMAILVFNALRTFSEIDHNQRRRRRRKPKQVWRRGLLPRLLTHRMQNQTRSLMMIGHLEKQSGVCACVRVCACVCSFQSESHNICDIQFSLFIYQALSVHEREGRLTVPLQTHPSH